MILIEPGEAEDRDNAVPSQNSEALIQRVKIPTFPLENQLSQYCKVTQIPCGLAYGFSRKMKKNEKIDCSNMI